MDPLALQFPTATIQAKTSAIYDAIQKQSQNITQPNFEVISGRDVELLFNLYDQHFFIGWMNKTVQQRSGHPLHCRVSSRMTRAGGKTTHRKAHHTKDTRIIDYEIAISSRLLFLSFEDLQRPIRIGGLACRNRLEAFQRIMEHEIIHLVEFLAWDATNCSQPRFKALIRNIFGHTEVHHDLITPAEDAAARHSVTIGSLVQFTFDGEKFTGRINRINQRATVLVKSKDGQRYSDGKRYVKYYVPINQLSPVSAPETKDSK